MAISETATREQEIIESLDSGSYISDQVHRWSEMCFQFRKWERQHILMSDPSLKEQEFHQTNLKWLLRWTRLMHAMIADVEFPDQTLARELSGLISQLESSWRMVYDPLPDQQADKLLADVFPDEPRT